MYRCRWVPSFQASVSPSSSVDEEEYNSRVKPDWAHYKSLLLKHGYRLDTAGDVRAYYEQYWATHSNAGLSKSRSTILPCKGYPRSDQPADELCKDRGLVSLFLLNISLFDWKRQPDTLFRGTRLLDGKKIIIKAVDSRSHELEITRYLSSPSFRNDPLNHTIRELIPSRKHNCLSALSCF